MCVFQESLGLTKQPDSQEFPRPYMAPIFKGYRMGGQFSSRAASGIPFGHSSRGSLYSIPWSLMGTAQEHVSTLGTSLIFHRLLKQLQSYNSRVQKEQAYYKSQHSWVEGPFRFLYFTYSSF